MKEREKGSIKETQKAKKPGLSRHIAKEGSLLASGYSLLQGPGDKKAFLDALITQVAHGRLV